MESGKFNGMDKVYCLASTLRLIYFHKLLPKVSQSGKNLTARDIRVLNVFNYVHRRVHLRYSGQN